MKQIMLFSLILTGIATQANARPLYHIAEKGVWAATGDEYRPSSLGKEGFIHLSTRENLFDVANRYYHGRQDLVLLEVEVAEGDAKLKWDGQYPHYQGALERGQVKHAFPFLPNSAGFFVLSVFKGSAVLVIKPAKVEEFKLAVARIIGPTRSEAGNISYEAYQVLDEKGNATNRFEFHEIWVNEQTMMVDHKENSPHMKEFFSLIGIGTDHSWVESFEVGGKTVTPL